MANLEALLLSRLIIGSASDRRDLAKYHLEPDDFKTFNQELSWCQSFEAKYGKYPGSVTFLAQFPDFKFYRAPEPLRHYADIIVERKNKNRLVLETRKIAPMLDSGVPGDVNKALAHFQRVCDSLTLSGASNMVEVGQNPTERFSLYKTRYMQKQNGLMLTSPYNRLNAMIPCGFVPENLITLASRTNVGKTWLLCLFAIHWWLSGIKVLFVTKEMSEVEIQDRIEAIFARLNWIHFQQGNLDLIQRHRYAACLRRMKIRKNRLVITSDAEIQQSGIETLVTHIETNAPDAVIVDGLAQYGTSSRAKSQVEKMMEVSQTMKRIAKKKKIVIMQSVHTNRESVKQKGGGGLAGISWGDAIGNDSDFVFELLAVNNDLKVPERLFKNVKGRNSSFGEFYINLKVEPEIDLSELSGSNNPAAAEVPLSSEIVD